ncbi:MAG: Na+/H+ antiporter NhaA [bacterium]|nr:Na+/H+ antiporter NhaA [bacterium]
MSRNRYPLAPLFGRILSPLEQFLQRATAGGIILIATTLLTIALSTCFGGAALHHFWEQEVALSAGTAFELRLSLHHWVNDGLMALFFLMVGLELKREILVGELASLRDAALPIMAALGGMMVPALIYAAFNAGQPTMAGWGIPMATDIAFAIGILVLLGPRIPKSLIIFLMALAIADDLGAVLVIAVFYTQSLNPSALMAAGLILGFLILLNRGGVRHPLPYALLGILLWYAVLASGIHATIAGILLAFTIPAFSRFSPQDFDARIEELHTAFRAQQGARAGQESLGNPHMATIAAAMEASAAHVQSPLLRIEHGITPWVTFLIIPVFALSNAGIDLGSIRLGDLLEPVTTGVFFGLVLGKVLGISLFSRAAVRFGLARLPAGITWHHLTGAAWLGGIGFTMSLFISQLAFSNAMHIEQAKLGILLASAAAAATGLAWLLHATKNPPLMNEERK